MPAPLSLDLGEGLGGKVGQGKWGWVIGDWELLEAEKGHCHARKNLDGSLSLPEGA